MLHFDSLASDEASNNIPDTPQRRGDTSGHIGKPKDARKSKFITIMEF